MTKKIIRGTLIGSILGIILATSILTINFCFIKSKTDNARETISDVALRFHVKANSDSPEDIELKYTVRDAVLEELSTTLSSCENIEDAYTAINNNLDEITALAQQTVYNEGYNYPVLAYLSEENFPMRQYGELIIPAGLYEALRIDIGNAHGENFWCLLYPTLCYSVDSASIVSRDGSEEIKKELSDEEYDRLFIKRSIPKEEVKVKFFLLEALKDLF